MTSAENMAREISTMRALCFLISIAIWGFASPAGAEVLLGLVGGVNRYEVSGVSPDRVKYRDHSGYMFGVLGELAITEDIWLSLQPALVQKGAKIAFKVSNLKEPVDSVDVLLEYVSVPIMLKVVSGNGKTYVSGGVQADFLTNTVATVGSQERGIDELIKSTDVAANFAFGVMVPVGRPRLLFELRYSQGLRNVAEPGADPLVTLLPKEFKSSGWMIWLGLLLPLGGS